MELYDEEKMKNKNTQETKLSKIIKILIIVFTILIFALIGVIFYLINNPSKITIFFDGEENANIEKVLEIKENENGDIVIHAPIKEFASMVGYSAFDGDYLSPSQNSNICNVQNSENVSIFRLDSSIINKKDLTVESSEYESFDIGEIIYEKDGVLYTNKEGLQKGFNIVFDYDAKKKYLNIYSLDTMVDNIKNVATSRYNVAGIDDQVFANKRAILDRYIIITSEEIQKENQQNVKYGVISVSTGESILETKYEKITYIPEKKLFLVNMNNKVGIFDSEGQEIIKAEYDELIPIDKEDDLYLVKSNGLYGVINGKGKTIIYLEYSQIGIDTRNFENNMLKTGYVLFNKLIPVRQTDKWGFFDKKGSKVTEMIYDDIGCYTDKASTAEYGLAVIQNQKYNLVVVKRENNYNLLDLDGKELLQNVITKAYMKLISGNPVYYMEIEDKTYNIIDELEKKDQKEM